MKLKLIEDGMVVHCKTEDEAKELIKWAYECGYENGNSCCWHPYKECTCYHFGKTYWTYESTAYFKCQGYEITDFTDLIIPEEPNSMMTMAKLQTDGVIRETMKMSIREILDWMLKHYEDGAYAEAFGEEYLLGYLLNSFTAKEIASKIEAYEDRKEQEKELEFEFVYRVFNYKENKYEFYPDIKTAISRCKELLRLNPDVYAKYEKVLRVKRSDEE